MAYITEGTGGRPVVVIERTRDELLASDEVAVGGKGVYRIHRICPDDTSVVLQLVAGAGEDFIDFTLRQVENHFGETIRVAGRSARPRNAYSAT